MDALSAKEPLRVLMLGMRCRSTQPVAAALIADPGIELGGVVVPGSEPRDDSTLDDLLRQNSIPLFEASSLRKRDLAPFLGGRDVTSLDAIVSACFPWWLPRWLRDGPRFGALNVHPSLLPALRGPEPEFWAVRLGLRVTGVSVHLVDEGLDTGPILLQRPVPIPEDVTLPELETSLAVAGGELVRDALHGLAAGAIMPRPQEGYGSYAPNPGPYDLTIPTNLPAAWAARFARAILPVYGPLSVLVMTTGQRMLVDEVIGVDEDAILATPVEGNGDVVSVRFPGGVVRFHWADG